MTEKRPYPSDLSDARWKLVEPVLTAWCAERRGRGLDIGRPPQHDLRAIFSAILYVDRTGSPGATCPRTARPGPPCTALRPLAEGRRIHPAGRKGSIGTDTLGLLLAVLVTAASAVTA
ncbi:transposase [Microbispora bryophytorum]|uniref:transposase n=1 Tax=Microbispora bryophytorum TaxID=1460882 RepID=UPI0033E71A21